MSDEEKIKQLYDALEAVSNSILSKMTEYAFVKEYVDKALKECK